jgi:hypothetical protein
MEIPSPISNNIIKDCQKWQSFFYLVTQFLTIFKKKGNIINTFYEAIHLCNIKSIYLVFQTILPI